VEFLGYFSFSPDGDSFARSMMFWQFVGCFSVSVWLLTCLEGAVAKLARSMMKFPGKRGAILRAPCTALLGICTDTFQYSDYVPFKPPTSQQTLQVFARPNCTRLRELVQCSVGFGYSDPSSRPPSTFFFHVHTPVLRTTNCLGQSTLLTASQGSEMSETGSLCRRYPTPQNRHVTAPIR
jgi:hypothetical protein